jgi:methylenetetrahydrofolate--tRNA-(uracil-5-)-methyltransferase
VTSVPGGVTIVASGPLTSDALAADIARLTGGAYLYFWDAIAPIVTLESVDFSRAFRASRYGRNTAQAALPASSEGEAAEDDGDYINCPMTRQEYEAFVDALIAAETATLRDFEMRGGHFFEGCLPVEVLARRGRDALAYGPMRPVGIRDPRSAEVPHAVVQLRQDNLAGTLYNLVGFQTNLKFGEQDRVLRMIPGLQQAEFVRYGQIHRNTFINSPALLDPTMQFNPRKSDQPGPDDALHAPRATFFAGQIVGVEGYAGNAATGLLAGVNASRLARGLPLIALPRASMIGALCGYVCDAAPKDFQPMKANFGILPPLGRAPRDKRARAVLYADRARKHLDAFLEQQWDTPGTL